MTLPGPVIVQGSTPPPSSAPTDVGPWFVGGLTERGPLVATEVRSLADYVRIFGEKVSYGLLYNSLKLAFAEGAYQAWVSRVVGPAATKASGNIFDQAGSVVPGDVALEITAKNVGEWGNSLNFEITVSGTDFTIIITHDTLGELERSPLLADRAAAITWASTAQYVDLALKASNEDPRAQGPTSLAGGADDKAAVTDAHWQIALDRFGKDLGPGKVSFPGRTTTVAHGQLLTHGRLNRRRARLDFTDVASASTLRSAALAARALPDARYGGGFAPWALIPGTAPGAVELVPYSALQVGLEARSLAAGKTSNEPAAGDNGRARFAIGLSQPSWTDADRELLNDAGVNVAISDRLGLRSYGYRTLVDPVGAEQDWVPLSNSDLMMELEAKAYAVAEQFEFRQLDGARRTIGEFGGALVGMLMPYYTSGALFGATPEEAFTVDVDSVNTPATIAKRELHAAIGVRMSSFGEIVRIVIAKVPVTQALA